MILDNINKNNEKILKLLDYEIQLLDPTTMTSFKKLKEFLEDFSLEESVTYLLQIFNDSVF